MYTVEYVVLCKAKMYAEQDFDDSVLNVALKILNKSCVRDIHVRAMYIVFM